MCKEGGFTFKELQALRLGVDQHSSARPQPSRASAGSPTLAPSCLGTGHTEREREEVKGPAGKWGDAYVPAVAGAKWGGPPGVEVS